MVRRAELLALTCLTSFGVVSLSSIQTSARAQSPIATSYPFWASQAETILLAQSSDTPSNPGASFQTSNPVLLAPGSKSSDVMILQQRLQQLGYYKGSIDGSYGSGTQQAVRGFQEQAALPATGSLDQLTWQQMQTPQLFPNSPSASSTAPSAPQTAASPNTAASATVQPQPVPSQGSSPSVGNPAASAPISAPAASTATTPSDPGAIFIAPEAEVNQPADSTPTESEKAESAQNEGRVLRGAIALLSLLLVLTSTALLIVFVRKRLQQRHRNSQLMPLGTSGAGSSTVEMETDTLLKDSNLARAKTGHQSSPSDSHWASSKSLAEPGLLPLEVEETTRLSRVNITDQLVADLASQDSTQRHKTIWELGQRGNSTAIQPLVEAMLDADSKERSLILAALSEIGMRTLKPMNRALALSLQDENPEVRKNAIRDLTRVYDQVSQMSQMLGRAVQDNDAEVRDTAQWALDQLGRIRSLPSSSLSGVDPSELPPQLPNDSSRPFRS